MLKQGKKKISEKSDDGPPVKKVKKSVKILEPNLEKQTKPKKIIKKAKSITKETDSQKTIIKDKKKNIQPKFKAGVGKFKSFNKDRNAKTKLDKPADWIEFKKKKKEVQKKRKENRNLYDVIVQAKKIGETLRKKNLKEGADERKKLTEELHELLGGEKNYPKYVLAHDMARIVQYLLKFGSIQIRKEVAQVIII